MRAVGGFRVGVEVKGSGRDMQVEIVRRETLD